MPVILAPFKNIAVHIKQPHGIWSLLTSGIRIDAANEDNCAIRVRHVYLHAQSNSVLCSAVPSAARSVSQLSGRKEFQNGTSKQMLPTIRRPPISHGRKNAIEHVEQMILSRIIQLSRTTDTRRHCSQHHSKTDVEVMAVLTVVGTAIRRATP